MSVLYFALWLFIRFYKAEGSDDADYETQFRGCKAGGTEYGEQHTLILFGHVRS